MTRQEALSFAHEVSDAINTHNVSRLMEQYCEDATLVSPMFSALRGRAAIAASFERTFAIYPDWHAEILDVLVDGNRIALAGTATFTDRNGWFGQPATGEQIDYKAMILLTLSEGKILRDERLYDLTGVLQRLEKSRLDKELEMAAEVQSALLSRTVHSGDYFQAAGDSMASRMIGGDFFEFLKLPSGEFAVALGDVAGKGPAAALLAAMIQGMLAAESRTTSAPAATLSSINRVLAERGLGPRFATLVYGVLARDGSFVYANAGHNPPLLLGGKQCQRLTSGGPVLGAFPDASFQQETLRIQPGETIVMFTDGLTDACNAEQEEFGEERLIALVSELQACPAVIASSLLRAVRQFSQSAEQSDDMTVAVTRYEG